MGDLTKELRNDRLLNCGDLNQNKYHDHIIAVPISQISEERLGTKRLSKRDFTMFHQNIRGLTINKIDYIFAYLHTNPVHVLCMSEHHLDMTEIETIRLHNYKLRAKVCRNKFKKGGVCNFTHDSIH